MLNTVEFYGLIASWLAVECGHEAVVTKLLVRRANIASYKRESLLNYTATTGFHETVRLLIEHDMSSRMNGLSLSVEEKNRRRLHAAAIKRDEM